MNNVTPCKKYCAGGEWHCDRCGFTWDLNDDEPPECLTDDQVKHNRGHQAIKQMKRELKQQ